MEDPDTDTLRKLAPCWTLAGDERLLTLLQNTHQRLVSKCQETNSQLERMATALDDASISLQNVNNQFMALSSSQFIERRVYDDDVDVAAEVPSTKESPKLSPPDELSMLKRSIAVIESTHEVITILQDSDSESDSDDDLPNRLVMKPKDVYANRPLPYIIGSEPWKSKWHAGLMPEDSDTDSSASKVDRESDQYSQSDPEDFDLGNSSQVQDIPSAQRTRKLSESSAELPAEPSPPARPCPADVARDLARRLGGDVPPKMAERESQSVGPAPPVVRTVYKPQEPVASTVFPDEPPPLDSPTDSDSDIFASLHRKQPYDLPPARPAPPDLFGGTDSEGEGGDIFSDFANQPPAPKPVSLFEAGPTPHMFDKQRQEELPRTERPDRTVEQPAGNTADTDNVRGVKKPVGGISLFGSNSGTENIGAAILQRNRRKSASSEESGNESQPRTEPAKEQQTKREKDIFDDLFAKSESKNVTPKAKSIVEDIEERNKKKQDKKDTPKPVDLFSDNLFDDIDDIFNTDVVKSSKSKNKSIFEDDDNLFSDIAETKPEKPIPKKEGLFDSDDDLFSENIPKKETDNSNKTQSTAKTSSNVTEISEKTKKNNEVPNKINKEPTTSVEPPNVGKGNASLFDDEEDDDDIFSKIKSKKETPKEIVANTKLVPNIVDTRNNVFNSPSLFGDDDDDESDLFTESSKLSANKVSSEILSVKSKNDEGLFEKDVLIPNEASIKTSNATSALPKLAEIEEDKSEIGVNVINETPHKTNRTESSPPKVVANSFKEKIESDNDRGTNNEFNTTSGNTIEASTSIESKNTTSDINKSIAKEGTYENKDVNIFADVSMNPSNINIKTKTKDSDNNSHMTSNEDFIQETKSVEVSNNSTNELKNNNLDINVPDVNIEEAVINTGNIIHDNSSEKDILASPVSIPSYEVPANVDEEIDNTVDKIPKSDIFTDIISEPPDFEKPKEFKKSKNVNALFDDDSDDESLFFKRDDVITDEKPDDFTVQQDRLFDLFTNEPPDEDFTQIDDDLDEDLFRTLPKPKLPSERNAATSIDTEFEYDVPILNDTTDDDRLTKFTPEAEIKPEYPKPPIPERKQNNKPIFITNTENDRAMPIKNMDSIFNDTDSMSTQPASINTMQEKQLYDDDDELFKSLPVHLPDSRLKSVPNHDFYKTDEELFRSLPHNINTIETHKEIQPVLNRNEGFKLPTEMSEPSDSKSEKVGGKKLGKLKVGLNINVNALLPGASPKKVKPVDNTDGQTQSQIEVQKDVPELPKLVSFDGEPESKVLDNKLSKERPRIQVKRRPSSRKARKEAVRKSGIDFGEDSTDNSSSIDDPPKTQVEIIKHTDNVNNNEVEHISDEDSRNKEEKRQESEEIKPNKTESDNLNLANPVNISSQTENTETLPDPLKIESEKRPVKSDSTTKIVYILNDEDIFNTNAIEDPKIEIPSDINKEIIAKHTENVNTNVETNAEKSDLDTEPIIKTLGNTYKTKKIDVNKKSKSLFGNEEHSDDDEIFKSKKPAAKTTIFDSDSEGELFGTSKTERKVEKVIVKGSLFGDDGDDADDLFGVKTTKRSEPQQPSKSTASIKEPSRTTQAVFEDPLSLFGDDE